MDDPPPALPPGGDDPLPSVEELTAQLEWAIRSEGRPFFALAGLPVSAARWAERSIWSKDGGEGGEATRAFRLLVVRYGDDERWAKVGTWFGQHPRHDPSDARRESMVHDDMGFGLGLDAAEPGDGEAYTNRDGMWARIKAAQEAAKATSASTLTVDGEAIEAITASVGDHRRTWFYVPLGGVVFLHTCRWDGPTDLVRSRDYAAIERDGW